MKKILYLLMPLFFNSWLCSAQINLENGLVSYYPFNGNAKDATGNGFDGKVYGASRTEDRAGLSDKAYAFDGSSSYIDLGENFNSVISGSGKKFSFSVWIKPADSLGNVVILAKQSDYGCNESERQFAFKIYYNRINFLFSPILGPNQSINMSAKTSLKDFTKWHHVVLTYDGTVSSSALDRVKIYIDNHLEPMEYTSTQSTTLGDIQPGAAHMGIGNYLTKNGTPCQENTYFLGAIDDIRIYSRLLNTSEVEALYKEDPASVQTFTQASYFSVYPNPSATGIFYCNPIARAGNDERGNYTLEVYDITGKPVIKAENSSNIRTIDLSGQASGLYLLRITGPKGVQTAKLYKQ